MESLEHGALEKVKFDLSTPWNITPTGLMILYLPALEKIVSN